MFILFQNFSKENLKVFNERWFKFIKWFENENKILWIYEQNVGLHHIYSVIETKYSKFIEKNYEIFSKKSNELKKNLNILLCGYFKKKSSILCLLPLDIFKIIYEIYKFNYLNTEIIEFSNFSFIYQSKLNNSPYFQQKFEINFFDNTMYQYNDNDLKYFHYLKRIELKERINFEFHIPSDQYLYFTNNYYEN